MEGAGSDPDLLPFGPFSAELSDELNFFRFPHAFALRRRVIKGRCNRFMESRD